MKINNKTGGKRVRDEKEFQMAMFKYGAITPLLHESNENLQSRMQKLSEKFWTLPDGASECMPEER